ncbi:host-nuclease inhibitor protein Gam [Salmonella enterica]|nr:host-nuclease inhibitor protein Gam [Salmonella enterica]EAX1684638.1 host-nuclease inhibitor protein Gam [Salmonella enterica]EAX2537117.1 host-nuclease inhibitor protein Gam [Salmonella enterica]EAY7401250.1 host-nuclease inhibitor protein Gam [Salmonella enterica]EBP7643457.1 host-nuclease inhibitor protein Gam [Salmonella enterica]
MEAQDWTRHYQQIAREEKESELSDDLEKGLSLHMLESLCIDELQRRGASKQAISRAFDDDVEFQERASEFVRYMAETFSRHQIDIESEE